MLIDVSSIFIHGINGFEYLPNWLHFFLIFGGLIYKVDDNNHNEKDRGLYQHE